MDIFSGITASSAVLYIIIGFFVAAFGTLIGAGGGVIHVPAMICLLWFPVHIATATSHFVLSISLWAFFSINGSTISYGAFPFYLVSMPSEERRQAPGSLKRSAADPSCCFWQRHSCAWLCI